MSEIIDLAISSSNNLSFSSENKKSAKYDNSSLNNKIYNIGFKKMKLKKMIYIFILIIIMSEW